MENGFEMDERRGGRGTYLQEADLVAGAGFIIGMAGARMLKLGSTQRDERYGDQPSWQS